MWAYRDQSAVSGIHRVLAVCLDKGRAMLLLVLTNKVKQTCPQACYFALMMASHRTTHPQTNRFDPKLASKVDKHRIEDFENSHLCTADRQQRQKKALSPQESYETIYEVFLVN